MIILFSALRLAVRSQYTSVNHHLSSFLLFFCPEFWSNQTFETQLSGTKQDGQPWPQHSISAYNLFSLQHQKQHILESEKRSGHKLTTSKNMTFLWHSSWIHKPLTRGETWEARRDSWASRDKYSGGLWCAILTISTEVIWYRAKNIFLTSVVAANLGTNAHRLMSTPCYKAGMYRSTRSVINNT